MTNKPNSLRSGISAFGALGKSAFALAISAILAGSAFADNVGNQTDYNTDVAAAAETTTTVTSSIAFTGPIAAAASSSPYTLQGISTLTQPTLQGAAGTGPALTIATPVALIKNLEFTQFTTGAVAAGNIVRLEDVRFAANAGGGAVSANNLSDGILNGTFVSNSNTADGGALAVAIDLDGDLNNVRFSSNNSSAAGGAIYVGQDFGSNNATSAISNGSVFNLNTAATDGGAIYVGQDFDGAIDATSFDGNVATAGAGGAISIGQDFGSKVGQTSQINATSFTNNTAATNGGAIAVGDDFDGVIDGSNFQNNTGDSGLWRCALC